MKIVLILLSLTLLNSIVFVQVPTAGGRPLPKLKAGTRPYTEWLTDKQKESANFILPYLTEAIKRAENNRNYGVLSVKTDNPRKVLMNSIVNNFASWIDKKQPGRFVDFMQRRWAP